MSSVNSINEEYKQNQKDNFIRIQDISKYSSKQQSNDQIDSEHLY